MKTNIAISMFLGLVLYCYEQQEKEMKRVHFFKSEPRVLISIFSDGQLLNKPFKISVDTKSIDFKATIYRSSNLPYSEFLTDVIIQEAQISLARGNHKIAYTTWHKEKNLYNLAGQMRPGDRLIIEFIVISQLRNGDLIPLSNHPQYILTVT